MVPHGEGEADGCLKSVVNLKYMSNPQVRCHSEVPPAVLEDFFYFVVWWLQGKLAEALPLLEKSLAIRKQVLGDDHPKVAESLNNIANLYQAQVL